MAELYPNNIESQAIKLAKEYNHQQLQRLRSTELSEIQCIWEGDIPPDAASTTDDEPAGAVFTGSYLNRPGQEVLYDVLAQVNAENNLIGAPLNRNKEDIRKHSILVFQGELYSGQPAWVVLEGTLDDSPGKEVYDYRLWVTTEKPEWVDEKMAVLEEFAKSNHVEIATSNGSLRVANTEESQRHWHRAANN